MRSEFLQIHGEVRRGLKKAMLGMNRGLVVGMVRGLGGARRLVVVKGGYTFNALVFGRIVLFVLGGGAAAFSLVEIGLVGLVWAVSGTFRMLRTSRLRFDSVVSIYSLNTVNSTCTKHLFPFLAIIPCSRNRSLSTN